MKTAPIAHIILLLLLAPFCAMAQYQFIENKGQWEKPILFRAYVNAGEVYLENDGIRFLFYDGEKVKDFHQNEALDSTLDCHALKLKLVGAQKPKAIEKEIESYTNYNYFLSDQRSRWASGVKAYEKMVLKDVYPNIDFEVYSYQHKIKYNFYVHPGANPSQIKIEYQGADDVVLENGLVTVYTSLRKVIEERPFSYEMSEDGKPGEEVKTKYNLDGNVLSFDIKGAYRQDRLLVIDPSLVFGTFSGSTADNFGYTATYDERGNAYSGGTVYTFGFPVTLGAFQVTWNSGVSVDASVGDIPRDIGILKYSSNGTRLEYATYIGGSHNEDPHSMVVNNDDELVIFGNTGSANFPTTISAYDTSFNGGYDIFVCKLSYDGRRLLSSTYVGGSGRDGLNGRQGIINNVRGNSNELGFNYGDMYRGEVVVNEDDHVFIATTSQSKDFPADSDTYQDKGGGKHDGVLLKLNANLSSLMGSTYFGGTEHDALYGISLDSDGNVYACGGTRSEALPFVSTAFQDTFQGLRADGIIVKFNSDLDSLLAGTYFGTDRYDQCYFLQTDEESNVYVTGQTTDSFFLVRNVKFSQLHGKQFIAKLSPQLDSLVYCGTFGSGRFYPDLSPSAFLVDQCARIYFAGWGGGANFNGTAADLPIPYPLDAEKSYPDSSGSDFYLAVFAENMDTILYGSYFGGDTSQEHVDGGTSRYSRAAIVYQSVCAGCTAGASDFPTTTGAVSETNGAVTGNLCNNALFKLNFDAPVLYADFKVDEYICIGNTVKPENRSINALEQEWDFGDGFTSKDTFPSHTYADTGWYTIRLIVSNIFSCPGKDTVEFPVYIYKKADADFSYVGDDCGWAYDFQFEGLKAQTFNWHFGDSAHYSQDKNPSHRYDFRGTYKVRLITDSGTTCQAIVNKTLILTDPLANFRFLVDSCEPYVLFFDSSENALNWEWTMEPGVVIENENPGYLFPDTGTYNVLLKINVGKPCLDSISKAINIDLDIRDAVFSLELDSCNYTATFINQSRYFDGVRWDIGSASFSSDTVIFDFSTHGSYDGRLVVDPHSICPDTSTRYFDFAPVSESIFSATEDTCIAKASTLNLSKNAGKYRWEADGKIYKLKDPDISFSDTGTYEITLITNPHSACADTSLQVVDIQNDKLALFSADTLFCELALVLTNESRKAFEFKWDFGNGTSSQIENPDTVWFDDYGTYEVRLIIEPGDSACSDTFSQSIAFVAPVGKPQVIEDINCFGSAFFASRVKGSKNHRWLIDNELVSTEDSFAYTYDTSGTYTIEHSYETADGCPKTEIITDSIFIPKASFELSLDSCTNTVAISNFSEHAESTLWRLDAEFYSDDAVPSLILEERNKIYQLQLIINEGTPCADTTQQQLGIEFDLNKLKVPNVITANGDGKNDLAQIVGDKVQCDILEIIVFNRWGQELYRANGPNLDWKPVNKKDKELSPGVYYYLLRTSDAERNGSFTVVR